MKRTVPSFIDDFKSPRIFLEDLMEIEQVLRKELQIERLKVSTDTHEYESISEMPNNNKALKKLIIQTYPSTVDIYFGPYGATVKSYAHGLNIIGAAEIIAQIIRRRERKIRNFILHKLPIYGTPIVLILTFFVGKQSIPGYIFFLCTVLVLLWLVSFVLWLIPPNLRSFLRDVSIELVPSSDVAGFFTQNKDAIVGLGIIVPMVMGLAKELTRILSF